MLQTVLSYQTVVEKLGLIDRLLRAIGNKLENFILKAAQSYLKLINRMNWDLLQASIAANSPGFISCRKIDQMSPGKQESMWTKSGIKGPDNSSGVARECPVCLFFKKPYTYVHMRITIKYCLYLLAHFSPHQTHSDIWKCSLNSFPLTCLSDTSPLYNTGLKTLDCLGWNWQKRLFTAALNFSELGLMAVIM